MKQKEHSFIAQSEVKIKDFTNFIEAIDNTIDFAGVHLAATEMHYCFFAELDFVSQLEDLKRSIETKVLPTIKMQHWTLSQFISSQFDSVANVYTRMMLRSLFQEPLLSFLKEISFDPVGKISIDLPCEATKLLSEHIFPAMSIVENQLVIDLLQHNETLFLMEQDLIPAHKGASFLIFHADALKEKIFYSVKNLDNNLVQLSPFLFLAEPVEPPLYHFVLDKSASMKTNLIQLKKTVLSLLELLFSEKKNARVRITFFDDRALFLKEYTAADINLIENHFEHYNAGGATALYATISNILRESKTLKKPVNVLLFTDGEESYLPESTLQGSFLQGFSDMDRAHIKLLLISYKAEQPLVLQNLTECFSGALINTEDVDFTEALQTRTALKSWVNQRQLFRQEVCISSETNRSCSKTTSKHALDLGRVISLPPCTVRKSDKVQFTVYDCEDKVIAKDTYEVAKPPPSAKLKWFDTPANQVPETNTKEENADISNKFG